MRLIVFNINSPTQKIAKWLIPQYNLLETLSRMSVKSSIDFVHKVKDLRKTRNETMLSSDVKSLFSTIPVSQALVFPKKWLLSSNNDEQKCNMNINLAKICQNIFQLNGKFNR